MRLQADVISNMVWVFVLIIFFGLIAWIWGTISSTPNYQHYLNQTPTQHKIIKGVTGAENIFNNAALFMLITFGIISIVLAALSVANIALLFISILLLLPEVLLSFIFHDVFFDLLNGTILAVWVSSSSLFVMQFFTGIVLALWAITVIATFGTK